MVVEAIVTDGGTLSYQWYARKENDSEHAEKLTGETKAEYQPFTGTEGTFYYYCIITNTLEDCGDGGNKTASVSSKIAKITVKAKVKEETPNITIDYTNEKLTGFAEGASYTINGKEVVPENGELAVHSYLGTEITLIRKASDSDTKIDSDAQTLNVPARPEAPSVEAVDESAALKNDGKITGTTDKMEYQSAGETAWKACSDQEVTGLQPGEYQVRLKATDRSFVSEVAGVTIKAGAELVVEKPSITKQPESVSANVGETVTFTVVAAGSEPLQYQWKVDRNDGKGFVDIKGAVKVSYTTPAVDRSCNGFRYRCVVTNSAGSVESQVAVLTVEEQIPAHIHHWSKEWTYNEESHWHICEAEGCGITENQDKDGYQAHVYDNDRDADCNICGYTREVKPIVEAPSITKQPENASANVGETVTFTVTAAGSEPLQYQWKVDRNDGKGFVDIRGAVEVSYTTPVLERNYNGYQYRCVVTNSTGSVDSQTAILTVKEQIPEHIHQWSKEWTYNEDNHWHICEAEGCGITENQDKDGYQAHVYDNDRDADCNICGYRRKIKPIVEAPSITKQPESVSANVGETVTFTVTAAGSEPLQYQWKVDRNDGKGFVDIRGAVKASYTTPILGQNYNGYQYQCVVTNSAGSVESQTAVLTVKEQIPEHIHQWSKEWTYNEENHWHICEAEGCGITENQDKDGYQAHVYDNDRDADCNVCGYIRKIKPIVEKPSITKQPENVSANVGETVTFTVTAAGSEPLQYQWKVDRNDGKGFVDIKGAVKASYTTSAVDQSCNGFRYRCVVTNSAGSVESQTAVLTVREAEKPQETMYEIVEGANQSIVENFDGTVTIKCSGELSKFVSVAVDGNQVEGRYYTLKSGSTILTFHKEYLNTLSVGKHLVRFHYTDGYAETELTIREKETMTETPEEEPTKDETVKDNTSKDEIPKDKIPTIQEPEKQGAPKTADPAPIVWLAVLLAMSAGGLVITGRRKKQF